jgi:hypothetical protein
VIHINHTATSNKVRERENEGKRSLASARLQRIDRGKESKWYQCSKAQFILEGDSNTRYFHGTPNGRHRRKRIQSLEQDEGRIEGHKQLKSHITKYYKGLFGPL